MGTRGASQSWERAAELDDLMVAVKALIVPLVKAADDAAPDRARGHVISHARAESRRINERADGTAAADLAQKLAFALPPGQGLGKDGLLHTIGQLLRFSVNTWDQGLLDTLYASNNAVGVVSETVLAALNTNVYTSRVSPALGEVETTTTRALASLFGFQGPHRGGITCAGGSGSNLTSLMMARNALFPESKAKGNGRHRFVVLTSAHGHGSVEKAAMAMGLGAQAVWTVPVDEAGRMRVPELKRLWYKAKSDGMMPFYVNATAGTTVGGSYDALDDVARVCSDYGMWLHVDASWGGPVVFSRRHRHKVRGAEKANTIAVSPHKMLGGSVTCSFLLGPDMGVFHKANTLPAGCQLAVRPEAAEEVWDLADLTPSGRRGDALKFALAWVYHGAAGFEAQIDGAFDVAERLAVRIGTSGDFELLSTFPPPCLQVCFYYRPGPVRAHNTQRTHEMARLLVGRGYMVDSAPGERGSFFRVVVNVQTLAGTVDGLVNALEEVGREVVTEELRKEMAMGDFVD